MSESITDIGYLLIAEPFYNARSVPQKLIDYEGDLNCEIDLINTIQEEGFELVYLIHSERNDWDRYISSNMYHTIKLLRENSEISGRQTKIESHRRWQKMYFNYRKQYRECAAFLITRI